MAQALQPAPIAFHRTIVMARMLSEIFTLDEFVFSQTAARLGIDNSPSPEIVANLRRLAQALE
jgi:hypothetical protein